MDWQSAQVRGQDQHIDPPAIQSARDARGEPRRQRRRVLDRRWELDQQIQIPSRGIVAQAGPEEPHLGRCPRGVGYDVANRAYLVFARG